ncbi:MAG: DUF362 domain-containing protein [Candidatus Riflebacteria bacterium]|nr:DUF362 domain-containing protein [Candidatus Riflebacteria bacterium]
MTRKRLLRVAGLLGLTAIVGIQGGSFRKLSRYLDRSRSRVALVPCEGYGADLIRRLTLALDLGGAPTVQGKMVLIKPNFVDYTPGKPINTDPRFLGALIDILRARGAREIVVGEGPGNRRDVAFVLGESGLDRELATRSVRFVDLNIDDLEAVQTRTMDLGTGSRIRRLLLPRTAVDADVLISVAKLKTHHWTGVTLCMKNLFGLVPGCIYGWPKNILHWNGIDRSVLEIFGTVRPSFGIVDGITGMEGDGPLEGRRKEHGIIVAGTDLVAVDSVAARTMGVRPDRIIYLAGAEEHGLGRMDVARVDVVGEPWERHLARFVLPARFEHLRG